MQTRLLNITRLVACAWVCVLASSLCAQGPSAVIPEDKIADLKTRLSESEQGDSAARKKLALRRVIREGEGLIEQYPTAPNRFVVLGLVLRGGQGIVTLDNTPANREAVLNTCRLLAEAPNEYAELRLDADLLLSQTQLARQGADLKARAVALRALIERYRDTPVEKRVIRIAMLMALEFGDVDLQNHLCDVIAQRFADDSEMVIFMREKLAGQVFGAPVVGVFKDSHGKDVRLPMDFIGQTLVLFFWSSEDGGQEHVKALADAWLAVKDSVANRFAIVSINLDNLPDAGEMVLRDSGADWPALSLPEGRQSLFYKAYAGRDPTCVPVSPTGYAALYLVGGNSHSRGYERMMGSWPSREWAQLRYVSQLQSLEAGEFLVLDTQGPFDPAMPPEWKAVTFNGQSKATPLPRAASAVPVETLGAIQACFIKPPVRFRTPFEQVIAAYEKADALCGQAIAQHPDAPDLWLVRNRRIVAMMALWKLSTDRAYLDRAAVEAQALLDGNYPTGTDVLARFCLAREALHAPDADPQTVIEGFVKECSGKHDAGPALTLAALMSLEVGSRPMHERYRKMLLDDHTDNPMLWTPTTFMLDRYQRYWLYQMPFTPGWTYGRRERYFFSWGEPDDGRRKFEHSFNTLDGTTRRFPQDTKGKWAVVSFVTRPGDSSVPRGLEDDLNIRPTKDVNVYVAVLGDDTQAIQAAIKEMKQPLSVPVLLVPGGIDNPIVNQLGIVSEDQRPNILIVRPDGTIALTLSGILPADHRGAIMNVIEWQDELDVDDALARGDLETAKRLAFTYAPIEAPDTADAGKKKSARAAVSVHHLRARAKFYMAMKQWAAALADIETIFPIVNGRDGYLSMRSDELIEIENLRDELRSKLGQAAPAGSSE
ncbi:MAG: hypothetical protein GC164_13250 [Phycisphaera sp.]|nr:hypothetical protein [Phycisphaera sp.]